MLFGRKIPTAWQKAGLPTSTPPIRAGADHGSNTHD